GQEELPRCSHVEREAGRSNQHEGAGRMMRLRPKVSARPAMNGPVAPNRMMLTEIAAEMVLTSQPNARCRGTIITPGAARTPTLASVTRSIIVSTAQA